MKKTLSRLKKIELRDIWPHEATDFTKWLAQEENLDLLSDEIGISIKLIDTEVSIGKFNWLKRKIQAIKLLLRTN